MTVATAKDTRAARPAQSLRGVPGVTTLFPPAPTTRVAVTDLLGSVPLSTRSPDAPDGAGWPPDVPRPTGVVVERIYEDTFGTAPLPPTSAPLDPQAGPLPRRPRVADALARLPDGPRLPSWAIVTIGALALLTLSLAAALAVTLDAPPPALPPDAASAGASADADAEAGRAQVSNPTADTGDAPSPADFPAEPSPIPVDLLTRLEEASNEPLDVELTRLLDAVQHGFGRRSARLEPTLRSYVYRMASRFEWNAEAHRIAVTAPDPDLAAARRVLLEQLFADAVAAGRLEVGTGVGPHALTLVPE